MYFLWFPVLISRWEKLLQKLLDNVNNSKVFAQLKDDCKHLRERTAVLEDNLQCAISEVDLQTQMRKLKVGNHHSSVRFGCNEKTLLCSRQSKSNYLDRRRRWTIWSSQSTISWQSSPPPPSCPTLTSRWPGSWRPPWWASTPTGTPPTAGRSPVWPTRSRPSPNSTTSSGTCWSSGSLCGSNNSSSFKRIQRRANLFCETWNPHWIIACMTQESVKAALVSWATTACRKPWNICPGWRRWREVWRNLCLLMTQHSWLSPTSWKTLLANSMISRKCIWSRNPARWVPVFSVVEWGRNPETIYPGRPWARRSSEGAGGGSLSGWRWRYRWCWSAWSFSPGCVSPSVVITSVPYPPYHSRLTSTLSTAPLQYKPRQDAA